MLWRPHGNLREGNRKASLPCSQLTTKCPKPLYLALGNHPETPGRVSPDTRLQLLRLLYGVRGCPLTTVSNNPSPRETRSFSKCSAQRSPESSSYVYKLYSKDAAKRSGVCWSSVLGGRGGTFSLLSRYWLDFFGSFFLVVPWIFPIPPWCHKR